MAKFVPYSGRDTYQLHGIPQAHRRNIERRAVKQNTSFANIVSQALADQCGITYAPSVRKHRPLTWLRSDSLVIRVPPEVMDCVRAHARHEQITLRSAMLNLLSDAFMLKRPVATHVEPGREPGRKKGT